MNLPYEMRLLLSLKNAVGAGRMRQATRELVKAYIHGLDSAALDNVFELLAWNQGIGYFSSEIGPSTLFQAYKTIKHMEKQGRERNEICESWRRCSISPAHLPPLSRREMLRSYTHRQRKWIRLLQERNEKGDNL